VSNTTWHRLRTLLDAQFAAALVDACGVTCMFHNTPVGCVAASRAACPFTHGPTGYEATAATRAESRSRGDAMNAAMQNMMQDMPPGMQMPPGMDPSQCRQQ
jgi:hypothetical protein